MSEKVSSILARLRLDDAEFSAAVTRASAQIADLQNTARISTGQTAVPAMSAPSGDAGQAADAVALSSANAAKEQRALFDRMFETKAAADALADTERVHEQAVKKLSDAQKIQSEASRKAAEAQSSSAQTSSALTSSVSVQGTAVDSAAGKARQAAVNYGELAQQWKTAGDAAKNAGKDMMMMGGAIMAPLVLIVREASKMEETMNKFNVVFGESAEAVKDWADKTGEEMGRGKEQMYRFVSDMQDFFVPMGFGADEAQNLSKEITKLSVDIASFNNKSDDEVLTDLRAALSGSGEVMKKYGVTLNETTIAEKAWANGMDPSKISEQEKALLRYQIVLAGTKAAQGDAVRSADSLANSQKRLQGDASNASAEIGNTLLPAAANFTKSLSGMVKGFGDFAKEHPQVVQAIAGISIGLLALGGITYATGTIFSKVGSIIEGWPKICGAAAKGVSALKTGLVALTATPAGAAFLAIGGAAAAMSLSIGMVARAYEAAVEASQKDVEAAEKRTQSLQKQQAAAHELKTRLAELAKSEKLTAAEQIEAGDIISALTKEYGDQGIRLDETAGKIVNFDRALGRMNQQDIAGQVRVVNSQLSALQQTYGDLEARIENEKSWSGRIFSGFQNGDTIRDIRKQIDDTGEKIKLLQEKKNELAADTVKAASGQDTEAQLSKKVLTLSNLKKLHDETQKSEKSMRDASVSGAEKEVRSLTEVYNLHLKNLQALKDNAEAQQKLSLLRMNEARQKGDDKAYDESKQSLNKASTDADNYEKQIREAQSLRISVLGKSTDDVRREIGDSLKDDYQKTVSGIEKSFDDKKKALEAVLNELKRLQSEGVDGTLGQQSEINDALAKLEQGREKALSDAGKSSQKPFDEMVKSFEVENQDRSRRYNDSRQEKELDKKVELDPSAALAQVQALMDTAKASLDISAEAYKDAVRKARVDGVLSDDEKNNIDSKKRDYDAQSSDFERYRARFDRIKDDMEKGVQSRVQGTFNSQAAAMMTGTLNDPAFQTAKNTQEMVNLTRDNNKLLKGVKMSKTTLPTFG